MIDLEKIKDGLSGFLELRESDDSAISGKLKTQGLSLQYAERVSAFLPRAFCRIALSHKFYLGYSDSYKVEWQ